MRIAKECRNAGSFAARFISCLPAFLSGSSIGCASPPNEVVATAFAAIERGAIDDVAPLIADGYSDPLGDKTRVLNDLRNLAQAYARIDLSTQDVSINEGIVKLRPRVVGRLDIELSGRPTWKVTGPLEIDFEKDGEYRMRSGLLTDLRDIVALANTRRAALEGNDVDGYAKLLHPSYRDGDVDRDDTEARLRRDLVGVRIRVEPSLYRLELRGANAHLDEHYVLTVNDRVLPPAIARLTLVRSAGLWRISAGLYPQEGSRP